MSVPKWESNRAWFMVLPVVLMVAANAIVPLMTVINYSVQFVRGRRSAFKGWDNYEKILTDTDVHAALYHQLSYSLIVLAIEIPLGILIAKCLPKKGLASSLALVVIAIPLLIPFAVIGYAWRIFTDPGVGLLGVGLNRIGYPYNAVENWFDSWATIITIDVWHWTSLVALLAFAGLRSIPPAWYQAAQIDGASGWSTFRHVELPKLRSVLIIAVLLRFMDSFMIFTEPFLVNAGGPGSSTEMLSTKLYNMSVGSPTSGPAAAFSMLYLLLVLFFSYVLYSAMMRMGQGDRQAR